jgi:prepilin-type N-terminal cleavage/methylation domain-containing protein
MKNRARGGFTMIELIFAVVLGSVVVGSIYQVLIVSQRTYTVQNAQIQSQQTVRAGTSILSGELRELSRNGGDILAAGSDSVSVRVMRRFGLVCAVNLANGTIDVRKVGSWFEVGDSVVVYAENRTNTATDDRWITDAVTARDTTLSCGTAQAERLTVPAIASAASAGSDTVRVGSNLRSYTHYTYGLFTLDGAPYLGRREPGGRSTPMVGPLRSSSGLVFRYLDTLNAVTAVLTDIAQVEITLRTLSPVRGPNGGQVADSVVTRIFTRN